MNSRSIFGAKSPKQAGESRLFALLAPIFPANPAIRAKQATAPPNVADHGELGWTVELCRGHDLPPLRLSILAQPGARMALRFDSCVRARSENC